jgi:hypothetical protein
MYLRVRRKEGFGRGQLVPGLADVKTAAWLAHGAAEAMLRDPAQPFD